VVGAPCVGGAKGEMLTKTERACQQKAVGALGQFFYERAACVARCDEKTPQGGNCLPPYGGRASTCVQKAEARAVRKFGRDFRACVSDGTEQDSCPECYESLAGTCTALLDGDLDAIRQAVDASMMSIYCDDAGSRDRLTASEAKCRNTLTRALGKLAAGAAGCIAKCLALEARGKTDGSCDPLAPGDNATFACILRMEGQAAATITRHCLDKPECLSNPFSFILPTQRSVDMLVAPLAVCSVCGDGHVESGEECDDGNRVSEDGCSADCHLEAKRCGGIVGLRCPKGQFCEFEPGTCGFADLFGVCRQVPDLCPCPDDVFAPVCGCDGRTYVNDCERRCAGVSVANLGTCEPS
jgi:cysteine-rich repeat protein